MYSSYGEVSVTIKNLGEEAYLPDVYGESIIITRRFTKEGGSSYKIQSAERKTISNKRDELSAICDHMNIQVDNPMNVLTQGIHLGFKRVIFLIRFFRLGKAVPCRIIFPREISGKLQNVICLHDVLIVPFLVFLEGYTINAASRRVRNMPGEYWEDHKNVTIEA